ncbi:hypothetical protein D9X91_20310 [Falsibacillus albus]|uniref:Uncharacterized protein n=1 Tax=Falsibacillus albus TaxID=2478915 RepID=A0A3L7JLV7_9BACI|nr:hypothetical protein D9X91_20310 [Falsibacillus albus]
MVVGGSPPARVGRRRAIRKKQSLRGCFFVLFSIQKVRKDVKIIKEWMLIKKVSRTEKLINLSVSDEMRLQIRFRRSLFIRTRKVFFKKAFEQIRVPPPSKRNKEFMDNLFVEKVVDLRGRCETPEAHRPPLGKRASFRGDQPFHPIKHHDYKILIEKCQI